MSAVEESKTQEKKQGRRSSLKATDTGSKLDPQNILKIKEGKRHSVSFGQSNTFQFKAMKAMFQESHDADKPKKLTEEEHKKFIESRKKNKKKKAKKDPKEPFKGEAIDFKIKFKTELCKYYEANQYCPYGDKCAYAHGKENLRSKVTNTTAYRSKKCTQFFEQGYCPYGNRCQFAHQLKTNIINNPYDKSMSYSKILEIISKLENAENVKKLVEKPRLPVFESIYKCEKKKESRLLNDIKKLKNSGIF